MNSRLGRYAAIALGVLVIVGFISSFFESPSKVSPETRRALDAATNPKDDPKPAARPEQETSADRTYSPKEIAAARKFLRDASSGLVKLKDDDTALLVTFEYGVLPGLQRERLFQLVSGIAGADVVMTGHPRYIHFYDPTGEEVAEASPLSGIKLSAKYNALP